jgi:hypothetical protein
LCGADASGNIGAASFIVTVRGAAAQLAGLHDDVQEVGPGTSLADKVEAAQVALGRSDVPETCSILTAFISQLEVQRGKSIEADTATTFITDATRIRAVLGC